MYFEIEVKDVRGHSYLGANVRQFAREDLAEALRAWRKCKTVNICKLGDGVYAIIDAKRGRSPLGTLSIIGVC